MNRWFSLFLWVGGCAILFYLLTGTSHGAALIINQRLYAVETSFWERLSNKVPGALKIKCNVGNESPRPVNVRASAAVVTLDDDGNPVATGEYLKVTPELVTTYPNELTEFTIHFPATGGTLAIFSVLPAGDAIPTQGIKLQAGGGFVLGALWVDGKYNPAQPSFYLRDENMVIENKSDLLMRFNLSGMKGEKEDESKMAFFLEPGKSRAFPVDDSFDAYVLDWQNGKKRLGLRLRETSRVHRP